MKRFRNKTNFKYAAVFAGVAIVAIFLSQFFPKLAPAFILLTIVFYAVVVQSWLIDFKRTVSRLEMKAEEQERASSLQLEVVERLGRKAVRNEGTVNNIAGSVGRMAPLVRQINENVVRVSKSQKAVQSTLKPDQLVSRVTDTDLPKTLTALGDVESLVSSGRNNNCVDINVMVIADEFTAAAFAKEWNQFAPTTTNYLEMLDKERIELLFVESAWEGNGESWRYQLVGSLAPRQEICSLLEQCKSRGIPTAFWNKEDPPHFDDFLKTAALFDYVFTTEESCVEEYRKRLGHENVYVLPFAAQPYYHNPARIRGLSRKGSTVFGGMYFREKYPERRQQMDFLLPAAGEFGLDIYSRNTKEEKYKFPDSVSNFVRGTLQYSQMLAAYHAYKVVLNVNSVPDSESMCARRIFEATACGAAVVSPSTNAIQNFFPRAEITTVDDRATATHNIRTLVRSDSYRSEKVHVAQRRIWEKHTYAARVRAILEVTGFSDRLGQEKKTISVIITTNRERSLPFLLENIRRQQNCVFELSVITHGFEMPSKTKSELEDIEHVKGLKVVFADASKNLGQNLNALVDMSTGDFIVRMDDDDWYGPHYVQDLYNAYVYSGADLVGKAATHIYFEGRNCTILTFEGHEHRYTDFVRGATFGGPRETFLKFRFPEIGKSEDSAVLNSIKEAGGLIYSADPFNFVVNRFADKGRHTWKIDDDQLFATGRMVFHGNGQDQLTV